MNTNDPQNFNISNFMKMKDEIFIVTSFDGINKIVQGDLKGMLGYDNESFIGTGLLEHLHQDDFEFAKEVFAKALAGEQISQAEVRLKRKDGSFCWVECNAVPVFDELNIYTTVRNISNRKDDENKAKLLANTIEKSNWGLIITNRTGSKIEFSNNYVSELLSYENEDFDLIKFSELINESESKDKVENYFNSAEKTDLKLYCNLIDLNKKLVKVYLFFNTALDEQGRITNRIINVQLVETLYNDNTDLSNINEALVLALDSNELGYWSREMAEEVLFLDKNEQKILGFSKEYITFEEFATVLHEEDISKMDLSQYDPDPSKSYIIEFRVKDKSNIKWIFGSFKFIHDENGIPVRVLGINKDITDQKKKEFELIESKTRLEKFFNDTPFGIVIHKGDTIYDVNDQISQILGFKKEEIIGKKAAEFLEETQIESSYDRLNKLETNGELSARMIKVKSSKSDKFILMSAFSSKVEIKGESFFQTILIDESNLQQLESDLKENQQLSDILLSNSPIATILYSVKNNKILFLNSKAEEIIKINHNKINKFNIEDLFVHPNEFEEILKSIKENGIAKKENLSLINRGGFKFLANITGNYLEQHKEDSLLIHFEDLSAESFYYNAIVKLIQEGDYAVGYDLIEKLLKSLYDELNVDFIFLGKLTEFRDSVQTEILLENGKVIDNFVYDLKATPCENVIDNKACVYPENIQHLFPKDQLLIDMGIQSYIGIPIRDEKGLPQGLLVLLSKTDLEFADNFKSIAQIYATRIETELQRKYYQDRLKRSEQEFRGFFENSSAGFIISDKEGRPINFNSQALKLTGYNKYEFQRINVRDLNANKHKEKELLEDIWSGNVKDSRSVMDLIQKDGTIRKIDISMSAIFDENGKLEKMQSLLIDVTDRYELENEFKHLFDSLEANVVIYDKDLKIKKINKISAAGFQKKPNELIGCKIEDLFPTELVEPYYENLNEPIKLKRSVKREDLTPIGNDIKHFTTIITPFFDENGDLFELQKISFDTTNQFKNKEEIKELNDKLHIAISSAKMGVWDYDIKNNILVWDESLFELYGIKREDFSGVFEAWENTVHPEDLERARNEFFKSVSTGKPFDTQFRIIDKAGGIRYIKGQAEIIKDDSGNSVRVIGVNSDITETVLAEKAVRESNQRYKFLTEFMPHILWLADTDGKIYFVNQSGLNYFGLELNELVADQWQKVIYDDDLERVNTLWDNSIQSGEAYNNFQRMKNNKGDYRWLQVQANPMLKENGEIDIWFGLSTDIHDQYEAEMSQRESLTRLEKIFENTKEAICVIDMNNQKFLDFNSSAYEQLGYSKEEFMELTIMDIEGLLDEKGIKERIKIFNEIGDHTFETLLKTKEGKVIDYEISLSRIVAQGSELMVTIWRNISERKAKEKSRIEVQERLVKQRESIRDLLRDEEQVDRNLNNIYEVITKTVSTTLNVGRVSIWSYSVNEISCEKLYELKKDDYKIGAILNQEDYPNYFKALKEFEIITTNIKYEDEISNELKDYFNENKITTLLYHGIYLSGELQGVICLEHVETDRVWTDDEIQYIETISSIISQYISAIDRKEFLQRVEESETRLNSYFINAPVGIVVLDTDLNIKSSNPNFDKIIKTDNEINSNFIDLVSGEYKIDFQIELKNLSKSGSLHKEIALNSLDGKIRSVICNAELISDESVILFVVDITNEEQLKEKYHNLFNMISIPIVIYNNDLKIKEINKQAAITMGHEQSSLIGKEVSDLMGEARGKELEQRFKEVIRKGSPEIFRDKEDLHDGEKWFTTYVSPIYDLDSNLIEVHVASIDITDEMLIKEQLEDIESRFENLFKYSTISLVFADTQGMMLESNPAFIDFIGYEESELIGMPFGEFTHPDDLPVEMELVEKLFAKKTKSYRMEKRFVTKSGDIKWGDLSVIAIYSGDEISHVVGVVTDITPRKTVMSELEVSEIKYRTLVNSLAEGIVLQDSNDKIIATNDAACELLGLTEEELYGRDSFDPRWKAIKEDGSAFDGKEHPSVIAMRTGKPCKDVVMGVHKPNGDLSWLQINSMPIFYNESSSKPDATVTSFINITERKNYYAQILDNERLLTQMESIAKIGGWEYDLIKDELTWTNETFEIHGLQRTKDNHPKVNDAISYYHEDYQDIISEAFKGLVEHGTSYDIELKFLKNKKEEIWIRTIGVPVYDDNGKIIKVGGVFQNIDELYKSRQEVVKQNKLLNSILSTSNEGFLRTDAEFKIQEVNSTLCTMLGYTMEELLAKQITDIVHPESSDILIKQHELRKLGYSNQYEINLQKADGNKINAIISASPLYDEDNNRVGSFAFITNVTTIKNFETELIKSYREVKKYKTALDLTAIVTITNPKGIITYSNENFLKISKYSKDEIIGKNQNIVNSGFHDGLFWRDFWATITDGRIWSGEIRNRKKDGNYYWVNSYIIPIKGEKGKIVEYLSIRQDITDKKRAEQGLMELNQELENKVIERTEKLNDLNNEKDNLIGMVSHDLKNPLSGIMLYSELIKQRSTAISDEKLVKSADNIMRTARKMTSIITNLLDLSRVESGNLTIDKQDFALKDIMNQVISHNEGRLHLKRQELIISQPDEKIILYNDPNLISQILDNLLSNAIKYSEIGKRIWIESNDDGNKVLIKVKDEGQGIPENELKDVFKKFSKLSSKPTDGESSSGLGLSIVKHLTESCGGSIRCESKLGIGTTFVVEFPNE